MQLVGGVARGGPELPPPVIWQICKPYSNQGADYAPHTTSNPPRIQKATYTSELILSLMHCFMKFVHIEYPTFQTL